MIDFSNFNFDNYPIKSRYYQYTKPGKQEEKIGKKLNNFKNVVYHSPKQNAIWKEFLKNMRQNRSSSIESDAYLSDPIRNTISIDYPMRQPIFVTRETEGIAVWGDTF